MFQSSKIADANFTVKVLHSVCLAGLLTFSTPDYAADFGKSRNPCIDAVSVGLNSTLWGHGLEGSQWVDLKLEIPSPGIVTLDVAASGSAIEPSIGLFGSECNTPGTGAGVVIVQRFLNHVALVVQDPGTYVFRLAAQPLEEYKVRTGFTALHIAGIDDWEKDDDVIEIDPDQMVVPPFDPPLGAALPCLKFHGSPEVADDHGDTFPCATPVRLGAPTAGEIGNGRDGDHDIFWFVLDGSDSSDLWRVQLATTGETDTFGGLYDRHGQRLANADGGGVGANFRIIKTLSPGLYFVRIEGRHRAAGIYSLAVEASAW